MARQIPGFLSGRGRERVLAVVGCTISVLLLAGILATRRSSLAVLAAQMLLVVLLAASAWCLRSRLPLLNSRDRLRRAMGWEVVAVVCLIGMWVTALTLPLSAGERAAYLQTEYSRSVEAMHMEKWWEATQHLEKVILNDSSYQDVQAQFDRANKALHQPLHVVSASTGWKAKTTGEAGWGTVGFDDSGWSAPVGGTADSTAKKLSDPSAQFIWASGGVSNNSYAYFRKEIQLGQKPIRAWVDMNADDKYVFWINGQKVGEDKSWSTVERYDVANYLTPGRNLIAVEAYNDARNCNFVFSMEADQLAAGQVVPVPPLW